MVLGPQPLKRAGRGPGVKGLGLGFKCPPSQALPSVGPVGKEGMTRGGKMVWSSWCLPGVTPCLACPPLTTVFVP